MFAQDIIISPILSEKSLNGVEEKRYVFEVARNATKTQIKKAIEELFAGTKVDKINTLNCYGKYKRQGKSGGYKADYKKAYVTLKKDGKGISFFDNLN